MRYMKKQYDHDIMLTIENLLVPSRIAVLFHKLASPFLTSGMPGLDHHGAPGHRPWQRFSDNFHALPHSLDVAGEGD